MKAKSTSSESKGPDNVFIGVFVVLSITALFIFFSSMRAKGQTIERGKKDMVAKFSSISGKVVNNKVYLKWTVKNQTKDGYYIIEKSLKKGNYQYAGDLKGSGTSINRQIMYCFSDTIVHPKSIYRIIHINDSGELMFSKEIKIEALPSSFIYPIQEKDKSRAEIISPSIKK